MVFVVINGNKERIDNFCGREVPDQLMSNGPSLRVEFRSGSNANSGRQFKGFRAVYKFITGKNLKPDFSRHNRDACDSNDAALMFFLELAHGPWSRQTSESQEVSRTPDEEVSISPSFVFIFVSTFFRGSSPNRLPLLFSHPRILNVPNLDLHLRLAVCAFVYNSVSHPNGTFTSPNWPGIYPRDTECHYFFYGQTNERVHITFAYFDVEGVPP